MSGRSVSGTGLHSVRQPFRPRESELDRQPHVGGRHLGAEAAVAELRERVHLPLGVDQDVDLRVLQIEQVMRLDHLEALVHQGRRSRS